MRTSRLRTHLALVCGLAAVSVGALTGAAAAKDIAPTGTVTASTACSPVRSLGYKGDATTSDTGLATIAVDYSVKPCTAEAVVVETTVFETANPSVVMYLDPAAPLASRFTVTAVKVNFSYSARVTVRSASTGTVLGSAQIFVAANRKSV